MTLLLLAAWLPARLVTSCLQNARAPKPDKTGKKGQGSLVEMGVVCACKRPENKCGIVCVCIKYGEMDLRLRYGAGD